MRHDGDCREVLSFGHSLHQRVRDQNDAPLVQERGDPNRAILGPASKT
jgi:hypothetical protein